MVIGITAITTAQAATAATTASTVKTAATVAAAAAAVATAYGSYRQGQTAEAIAEQQAKQGRLDAISRRQKAEFDVEQHRASVRKLKGSQRVSLLASGVQLEGTALDILADTEVQAKIDEDVIRYNAELAASGLEAGANISSFTGKEAGRAGTISAGATLLSSAGKFSSKKKKKSSLLISSPSTDEELG